MPSEPTPTLAEFLRRYEDDDNEWWRIECGDHMNLFDEAVGVLQEIAECPNEGPFLRRLARKALGQADA